MNMAKPAVIALLFTCMPVFAQHSEQPGFDEARAMLFEHHGNSTQYLVMADRFERADSDEGSYNTWDIQGWVGKDLKRFWFKTEGHDENDLTRGELQLLYSQGFSPWWDWQVGLRHDFDNQGTDRNHLVAGIQGLAPWWFETDAALFLSEEGDLAARLELEYDLFLTQRLILQPRLELDYAFSEYVETDTGQGLNELGAGLRLRYEWRRTFAPYIGIEWSGAYGDTADLRRMAGEATEEFTVVAGLRFWY